MKGIISQLSSASKLDGLVLILILLLIAGCGKPDRMGDQQPESEVAILKETSSSSPPGLNKVKGLKSGLEMVVVKGGEFIMGGEEEVNDGGPPESRKADECPHPVQIRDFYIGRYEVTQRDWETVMGTRPSKHKDCPDCPVEQISWYDALKFIERANQQFGESYRLPTEEEWEFAAKGGTHSKGYTYSGSNQVEEVAWFSGNSNDGVKAAGLLKPNELGVFDMSGNIWEWCSVNKEPYPCDDMGRKFDSRVLRGGSYSHRSSSVRVNDRNARDPNTRLPTIGLRLAK